MRREAAAEAEEVRKGAGAGLTEDGRGSAPSCRSGRGFACDRPSVVERKARGARSRGAVCERVGALEVGRERRGFKRRVDGWENGWVGPWGNRGAGNTRPARHWAWQRQSGVGGTMARSAAVWDYDSTCSRSFVQDGSSSSGRSNSVEYLVFRA